jgi:hypothetical protein
MAVYASWLVDAARLATAGTGKSVIVSPGWLTRGQGGLRVIEIVVGHHTGTPETAPGDYPSLNVVQNGRAGLVGLLSQVGLGRSGNVYVMGAGLAYHAGASAFAGFVDLNDESIGIEAEDSGDGRWTDAQLFMYPRLVRACLDYIRRGVDRYASHRTVARPAGRKNDPAGISDDWMRQRAASVQWQGKQEDDMSAEAERRIKNIHAQLVGDDAADNAWGETPPDQYPGWVMPDGKKLTVVGALQHIFKAVDEVKVTVDGVKTKVDQVAAGNVDYPTLAKALADEFDLRARDNNPATGPTT